MKAEESVYAVALSLTKGITGSIVKNFIVRGITPEDFFSGDIGLIPGFGALTEDNRAAALSRARVEVDFMVRHHITPLYLGEDNYPRLLAESGNPPVILYMLGNTDLNPEYSLSIVGTRKSTPGGNAFCSRLTEEIARHFPKALIVSGLAYGIDAAAHSGALAAGLPTAAVLGHGLDMIYPAAHRGLASTIIQRGGALLTEYPSGTRPHRNHFLERNRIVATISQGVLLGESPEKGGAMSTASIAFSYTREVMAVPGRPTDAMSRGCNSLIKSNKASMVEGFDDVCRILKWTVPSETSVAKTGSLFPELCGETKAVYDYMVTKSDPESVDSISYGTSIPVVRLLTLLTDMEFDGLVERHPGNRFLAIG